eukprot:TRINITY_DN1842_c0_g2_i1.p1 TRINITY_DN1842_c0_g2~~TRINITY_DN1842_c0_g2_i1.p1  ORF type:complete len:707 (+),score=224.12 TRINITY_DN1842_c0_g2_i1:307-2121(+)
MATTDGIKPYLLASEIEDHSIVYNKIIDIIATLPKTSRACIQQVIIACRAVVQKQEKGMLISQISQTLAKVFANPNKDEIHGLKKTIFVMIKFGFSVATGTLSRSPSSTSLQSSKEEIVQDQVRKAQDYATLRLAKMESQKRQSRLLLINDETGRESASTQRPSAERQQATTAALSEAKVNHIRASSRLLLNGVEGDGDAYLNLLSKQQLIERVKDCEKQLRDMKKLLEQSKEEISHLSSHHKLPEDESKRRSLSVSQSPPVPSPLSTSAEGIATESLSSLSKQQPPKRPAKPEGITSLHLSSSSSSPPISSPQKDSPRLSRSGSGSLHVDSVASPRTSQLREKDKIKESGKEREKEKEKEREKDRGKGRKEKPDQLLFSKPLQNVHLPLCKNSAVGGELSFISGDVDYYHYMHHGFDDSGWGCAYRSLQTICSWFNLQGYGNLPIPSHKDIQSILVRLGDKPTSFVGSKQWIGAIEISLILRELFGVDCKVLHFKSGKDVTSSIDKIAQHFKTDGTPIMIGGGVLAYTLLGVDYVPTDEDSLSLTQSKTVEPRFLILDPHYTGADDPDSVRSKGWCQWKTKEVFLANAFYNLCLPICPRIYRK